MFYFYCSLLADISDCFQFDTNTFFSNQNEEKKKLYKPEMVCVRKHFLCHELHTEKISINLQFACCPPFTPKTPPLNQKVSDKTGSVGKISFEQFLKHLNPIPDISYTNYMLSIFLLCLRLIKETIQHNSPQPNYVLALGIFPLR